MLRKKKYEIDDNALSHMLDIYEYFRKQSNFANARTVRNVLDQVIMNQNLRADEEESDDRTVIIGDVEEYVLENNIDLNRTERQDRRIGF